MLLSSQTAGTSRAISVIILNGTGQTKSSPTIAGIPELAKKVVTVPTVYLLLTFFLHFRFSFTHSLLFFYLLHIF